MAKEKEKETKQETALVTLGGGSYPALMEENRHAIIASVEANLGGREIRPFDLERVTVPSGGQPFWTVPSLDNPDGDPAKEVVGIIVAHRNGRGYWEKSIDEGGGGTPPDCFSDDGKIGHGKPGGICKTCALAQFGSDPKGTGGQACSEKALLFLLRPDSALPLVVSVPPTSLQPLSKYMLRLAGAARPYYSIETKLSLEKATSKAGQNYSRVVFTPGAKLDAETIAAIKEYAASLREVFASVRVVEEPVTDAQVA